MNSVIQKCVDELAKDNPRLDYVRGMLDTLLSMNESPRAADTIAATSSIGPNRVVPVVTVTDEGSALDAVATFSVDKIKALADKSTEIS